MYIKREGSETVNLKYTQSIEKKNFKYDDGKVCTFIIRFWQQTPNKCDFDFNSAKERDEYFDALMNTIKAEEVSLLKL